MVTSGRNEGESKAPRVVAIGGGTGLSALLRGLKAHTPHITAIVTVADDGGSSGRLRRELGVLPPGDFRNCIAALADDEALMTKLFQYRFGQASDLNGHSFGNLFITALAAVTGSFERALVEAGRVLAVQGRILPSTLEQVTLVADVRDEAARGDAARGDAAPDETTRDDVTRADTARADAAHDSVPALTRVQGESSIPRAGGPIERVFLRPEEARAYPAAVRAILKADLIVAGPGSLFTSVLPNLLVQDIRRAVGASRALKVYVCNVATQRGETDGFDVGQHVSALERHVGQGFFQYIVANSNVSQAPDEVEMVALEYPKDAGYTVVASDLVDADVPWRHNSERLAREIMDFYETERKRVENKEDRA